MSPHKVVVIGAGAGGLAAALSLSAQGCDVTVLERASAPGGKMRHVPVEGAAIDGGPTVFTMRWVFDGLFENAGLSLDAFLTLKPLETLARHAWTDGGRLDLYADIDKSADAIATFAGQKDADGYRSLCKRSEGLFRALKDSFMAAQKPSQAQLIARMGLSGLPAMLRTPPFATLWGALGQHFSDPRLRQLFARYSTYVGSSPFLAPATLMLIAHAEQDGVWAAEGGMHGVAQALQKAAERQGATFQFNSPVDQIVVSSGRVAGVVTEDGEQLIADAVVFNGDVSALATGLLGKRIQKAAPETKPHDRSLSAITWCVNAPTSGFSLDFHNVFFGPNYQDEFEAVFDRRSITSKPTVYICAQDRAPGLGVADGAAERMLFLVNAPAEGDAGHPDADYVALVQERTDDLLKSCGLEVDLSGGTITGPVEFNALFPATGGALYGRANHGPFESFKKLGASSEIDGLYLAGGSVHPGAGVPMATLSGRLAAEKVMTGFGA